MSDTTSIDAARSGFVDESKCLHAFAPIVHADDLVMRDLRRQMAFLTDADRFLDTVDDVGRLVAHVRGVDPAHLPRHARQLDDLLGRREVARNVKQPGAESERAVAHGFAHQRFHFLDFLGRRFAIDISDDNLAHASLADERREIRRCLQLFDTI